MLKPSAPKCLEKQLLHVLGTSLQGYLFSAVQSGAPEHTVRVGRRERREGWTDGEREGNCRWKRERVNMKEARRENGEVITETMD